MSLSQPLFLLAFVFEYSTEYDAITFGVKTSRPSWIRFCRQHEQKSKRARYQKRVQSV